MTEAPGTGATLIGGGLGALQTGVIITGLPFALVLLLLGYSLLRGLREDGASP